MRAQPSSKISYENTIDLDLIDNVPNILSMEALLGRVQLKILNCRFNLLGMSLRPPPGCIMAAKN